MGNLLAIAAAKVLRLSLVIFTSLEYIAVVPVVPVDPVLSSKCILVGYSAAAGSYYSVERVAADKVPVAVSKKGSFEKIRESCKCGRGGSKGDVKGAFCKQKVGGIPSRCGCYNGMKGCSEKCRCVACENPYGTSQNAKSTYTITRVRQPTKLKGQKHKSGADFLLERGAMPLLGWSDIESTIFDCLVDFITSEDVELNASTCLERYNDLRVVAEKQGINNIGRKTLHQVQGKLTQVKKCAAAYEAFYKKQIERNWFSQSTPQ